MLVRLAHVGVAALASALLCIPVVAATEEPRFERIDQWPDKNIELRDYGASIIAVASMDVTGNGGFSTLAGYIFGGNTAEQKIAMTAPVKTSMASSEVQEMAFVMPSKFDGNTLPQPNTPDIELRPVDGYVAAVIIFSGRASPEKAEKQWAMLQEFLDASEIKSLGPPTLNQYNPPWTLPFLRRNEIIVPIDRASIPEKRS